MSDPSIRGLDREKQECLGFSSACAALYAGPKVPNGNVGFELKVIAWSAGYFCQSGRFQQLVVPSLRMRFEQK